MCPGYQQRLQWSTKHEVSTTIKASGPANFTQLVDAASKSIISRSAKPDAPSHNAAHAKASPAPSQQLRPPSVASPMTTAESPSSSSSTLSPPPQPEDQADSVDNSDALVPIVHTPEEQYLEVNVAAEPPLVDIPSFLINHWFNAVCSSWSALDSQNNPYRVLTNQLWRHSSAVYFALQSISAASLVERLPAVMKETAQWAPRRAHEVIQNELVAYSSGLRSEFPSDLFLALFCMSSSMCWMEARQLGQGYVREARRLLRLVNPERLSQADLALYNFFSGCLIYEEMLRSVVSEDETDIEHMLSWPEPALPSGPRLPSASHYWTGVPIDVLRLFGKAMALVRRSRNRWRMNDGTSYQVLQGAMKDIEEAGKVEASLMALIIPQLLVSSNDPQATAQAQNLHYTTEAYRLSSLLQLYITFPDLRDCRLSTTCKESSRPTGPEFLTSLALSITDVLKKVPARSLGCIQPLVCLCAGSGLRYDRKAPLRQDSRSYLLATDLSSTESLVIDQVSMSTLTRISAARQFVMDRLEELEEYLPPKPIGVAKQLIQEVWKAYDEEIELPRRTHWLDVMDRTGLHSLFG